MKKRKEQTSIFEIFFVIAFLILVSVVVWYLLVNIGKTQEVDYSRLKGSIETVMTATDNAINKIYNILVITTVFFTILVASVSVFQFIKMKDVDKLKRELSVEINKNRKLLKKRLKSNNLALETLNQKYLDKINELEKNNEIVIRNLKDKIDLQIKQLNDKNIELEIDTIYLKIMELHGKGSYNTLEMKNHYDSVIELIKLYPEIKELDFKEKVFLDAASFYIGISSLNHDNFVISKKLILEVLKTNENVFTESRANRLMAELEINFNPEGLGEIPFLESVIEENLYDLEATILLMSSYDKRFLMEDISNIMRLAKCAIELYGDDAKHEIYSLIHSGKLTNILESNEKENFKKIIDFSEG